VLSPALASFVIKKLGKDLFQVYHGALKA